MKKNLIHEKSYQLALLTVKLSQSLKAKKEFTLADQLLRCGTSVCANIHESKYAESRRDFIHKLSISAKEANEVTFWVNLLYDSNIIDSNQYSDYKKVLTSVKRILNSILVTLKNSANP